MTGALPGRVVRADPPPLAARSRRLFWTSLAVVLGSGVVLAALSPLRDPMLLCGALAILLLGLWPALRWARSDSRGIPAFEVLQLTIVGFYALPLLRGHPKLLAYGESVLLRAVGAVLSFQVAAILAHRWTSARPLSSVAWTRSLLVDRTRAPLHVALWTSTAYVYAAVFTDWIPWRAFGVFRAAFMGVGIVSTFVLCRAWGARELSARERASVLLACALQILLSLPTLYLQSGIALVVLGVVGYVSTSRRVPLATVLLIAAAFAVLQNGKARVRALHWRDDQVRLEFRELPTFVATWLALGAASTAPDETRVGIAERTSLLQMVCLAVEKIPEQIPHLDGLTYLDLPAQLVPRALWPERPSPHESNQRLAVYFGLLDAETINTVSIACGMPAEAYANFGYIGVAALGALFGWGYKRLVAAARSAPVLSPIGLVAILLLAWSFQAELVVASWVTSLLQAAFVVIGLPVFFRVLRPQG